jgi:DNA gyrase inhibitor GyrI
LSSQEGGHRFTTLPAGQNPDGFEVQLRDLPARTVAYIRVLDPYRENVAQAACERLLAWAIERGLADGQWLGYMWEEPEIVALEDCRYDVALVVDEVEPAGRSAASNSRRCAWPKWS